MPGRGSRSGKARLGPRRELQVPGGSPDSVKEAGGGKGVGKGGQYDRKGREVSDGATGATETTSQGRARDG